MKPSKRNMQKNVNCLLNKYSQGPRGSASHNKCKMKRHLHSLLLSCWEEFTHLAGWDTVASSEPWEGASSQNSLTIVESIFPGIHVHFPTWWAEGMCKLNWKALFIPNDQFLSLCKYVWPCLFLRVQNRQCCRVMICPLAPGPVREYKSVHLWFLLDFLLLLVIEVTHCHKDTFDSHG